MRMTSISFTKKEPLPAKDEVEKELPAVRILINPARPNVLTQLDVAPQDKYEFVLFDRAAKLFWNPKFDSRILEEQYRKSTFPQLCQRFQYALLYIFIISVSHCIYFACVARSNWIVFVVSTFSLMCYTVAVLLFTYTQHFQNYCFPVSLTTTLLLFVLSLLAFITFINQPEPENFDISPAGLFCICIEILLLMYTVIPLPLYICLLIGGPYSVLFEVFSALVLPNMTLNVIVVKILLQLCVHLVGIHILLMSEVRLRSTFMKVGQSLLVRRDLGIEKHIKEKMIHSVMPPKVADWLMATQEGEEDDDLVSIDGERRVSASPRQSEMVFRPFNMHRMENVSILFADIVGFTKMSSNKTAEQLVGLLNDLFGRFDYLCAKLGCEKISTLGDCYYCVSGCPEPRPDHAKCCVEMGLGMIKAIGEFDEDTNEDVNMRVGVHTGTILCGIVGTRRFKFDVWSNDVTFANVMESTGKPGKVHISEATYSFLVDIYFVEEGTSQKNVKTYFITGRKPAAYERLSLQVTPIARHSWPTQPVTTDLSRTVRKPSQPEKGQFGEPDSCMMPMLPYPQQTSISTLSSSRKDSGIRSRRSSLQDTIFDTPGMAAHLLSNRMSSYCASEASVADTGRSSGSSIRGCSLLVDPNLSLNESLARLRHLRKQSDLQLIRCVQQDSSHIDYFVQPPINRLSLFFQKRSMEDEYRSRFHYRSLRGLTFDLSSSTLNPYVDVFVSTVYYIVVAISYFLVFYVHLSTLLFCFCGAACLVFVVTLCISDALTVLNLCRSTSCSRVYKFCTKWYPWHALGILLICLPAGLIFSNFNCDMVSTSSDVYVFFYLIAVSLVHFCNFIQLNHWLKSFLACLVGVSVVFALGPFVCPCPFFPPNSTSAFYSSAADSDFGNCHHVPLYEIILDVILISLLVWFLNREFEIAYRMSFHRSILAAKDKREIQIMKNQADWLLHNIIPKHVADQLKSTSKYSENHKDAGVLFASIVNFHELYDESFEGGRECLRVLNELVSDFDELLQKPEFRNVEKIKTIGSTFMAASGLNEKMRRENPHCHTHLFELMEFAIAMQQVIERFNYNLLEFNFIMRIGYNFGDVTAGVIGTTKLYYDIWGDTVNIASRMESHGQPGCIQVPQHCIPILQERFQFEPRGTIYVKGKDNMSVFLLVKKLDVPESDGSDAPEPTETEALDDS